MWNMLVVDNYRIKWYIAHTEISFYCTPYILYCLMQWFFVGRQLFFELLH